MTSEIELKIGVENLLALEKLTTRLGQRLARVEQSNLYFETDGNALRTAGWSLRIRHESEQVRLTLKGQPRSDGDFVIRTELERNLPNSCWPEIVRGTYDVAGEVRSLATEHDVELSVDLSTLESIGGSNNVRSVYPLPGDGEPLMVEVDETEYPDFSIRYEVELEVPADADRVRATQRLKALFDEAGVPWTPSRTSKYARFLAAISALE